MTMFVRQEPALAMMLSLYVGLGIFLLLAARNPSANRSLIAFTAWSSFVHAMLMAGGAFADMVAPGENGGSAAVVLLLGAWVRFALGETGGWGVRRACGGRAA